MFGLAVQEPQQLQGCAGFQGVHYIVGQTGTGKSTLLLNLVRQDLAASEGLALLDPHGDLAIAALQHIPRRRTNDLVYINPADAERPIGFNPIAQVSADLKPVVADGIVSAFRHVWPDSWGPRLDYILTCKQVPA